MGWAGVPRWVTSYAATEITTDPGNVDRFRAGEIIPGTRYRVLSWLGQGGMGVVYQAEHTDIERLVALKILHPDLSRDPKFVEQFREEARAASRVGSPNIAEVYDFAELDDGRLMFAMEFLDGPTLLDVLNRKTTVSTKRAVGIFRQACRGLAAAHAKGIVHRDIKPENVVLIDRHGQPDTVKLVDFGIAAVLAGGQVRDVEAAGTPHYIAPEIIRGEPFDERVDMYALGCMMYEMLAGRPPFTGETVRDVLAAHLDQQPLPIADFEPRDEVPPEIEDVILTCLGKEPRLRYIDMNDLEGAICEAQIVAGIETPFDSLPLPEVTPNRIERIKQGFAKMHLASLKSTIRTLDPDDEPDIQLSRGKPRRYGLLATAVVVALAGGVGTAMALHEPKATPAAATAEDPSSSLIADARRAAARGMFVFPPADASDTKTAIDYVVALEAMETSVAAEAAVQLRQEFGSALIHVADTSWRAEPNSLFTRGRYARALVFIPDDENARTRSTMSEDEMSAFVKRVAERSFTPRELADGAPRELLDRPPAVEPTKPVPVAVSTPVAAEAPRPKSSGKGGSKRSSKPAVGDLLRQAKKAQSSGNRDEAKRLYEKVVGRQPKNAQALIALSNLHFSRGDYRGAAQYAERAVKARPSNASYRIKYGDALLKSRKLKEAKRQYQKALSLGNKQAQWRIDKVDKQLGG